MPSVLLSFTWRKHRRISLRPKPKAISFISSILLLLQLRTQIEVYLKVSAFASWFSFSFIFLRPQVPITLSFLSIFFLPFDFHFFFLHVFSLIRDWNGLLIFILLDFLFYANIKRFGTNFCCMPIFILIGIVSIELML